MFELKDREYIVTAYAERACGPGWANSPIWVIVGSPDGLRQECIQPSEQTPAMQTLYNVSRTAHKEMVSAVMQMLYKRSCRTANVKPIVMER
jgi:hypothetical protein